MLLKGADYIIYSLLGFSQDSHLGAVLHFFIYDSVKILILLFVMISAIGFFRSFLQREKVKAWLAGKGIIGNFCAAGFGALTPFCSCSSIPIFLGFIKGGVPIGVTFSFLGTAPIINEYLVVLMLGFFGWKITLVYITAGILAGTFVGAALGKMNIERFLEMDIVEGAGSTQEEKDFPTFLSRVKFGFSEAADILKKIWKWILVGVGIGAFIHGYVPRETIQAVVESTGIFAVPLAVLFGVPMYGSCASIVPVAVALFQKGVPLGTAMAFMMATSALSLPEAILLRRAMKLSLIGIFFGLVTLYMIFMGYVLNFLEPFLV